MRGCFVEQANVKITCDSFPRFDQIVKLCNSTQPMMYDTLILDPHQFRQIVSPNNFPDTNIKQHIQLIQMLK